MSQNDDLPEELRKIRPPAPKVVVAIKDTWLVVQGGPVTALDEVTEGDTMVAVMQIWRIIIVLMTTLVEDMMIMVMTFGTGHCDGDGGDHEDRQS